MSKWKEGEKRKRSDERKLSSEQEVDLTALPNPAKPARTSPAPGKELKRLVFTLKLILCELEIGIQCREQTGFERYSR